MKKVYLGVGLLAMMLGPALAQNPTSQGTNNQVPNAQTVPGQGSNQGRNASTANIQQQIMNDLGQAGYTDVRVMPESFLVRAKDKNGHTVLMVINPDSIAAITEIPSRNNATTGSAPGAGSSGSQNANPAPTPGQNRSGAPAR